MRLALGALPGQILTRFLGHGLRVAAAGCIAVLIFRAAATRLIENTLYGVSTRDAKTYAGVVILIVLVATTASLVPGWRAARIEPVRVLRDD